MFNRLGNLFRRSRSAPDASVAQAHLTFGQSSVGRTLSRASLLLKKQLWIWPMIAVVVLAAIGYGVRVALERTMKNSLHSQLETILNIERSMLETWLKVQESNAQSLANDQQVRELAVQLLAASQVPVAEGSEPAFNSAPATSVAALNSRLSHELGPGMTSHGFTSYLLANKQSIILASSNVELMGQSVPQPYEAVVAHALTGEATVSPPYPSTILLKDEFGAVQAGVPTMQACVPIRDANFQVVAVLAMRIRPEREFAHILQLGRVGETGETYAIDKKGVLVSNSRFDEDLILLGLLPDTENAHSILNLSLRDPGGNLQDGFRPGVRRAKLPLTKAAAAATSGAAGIDVEGYRDYRGERVVGSWQWLPKYEMGLITEIGYDEAYRPLTILRWTFYSIFGLLALSSVVIFVFTLVVARLQREAQKAAIEAKHLGQYRLEEEIGAGAMGVVYKGQHAMLRRPTAIKLLNVEKVNEASIARFEREVQITCKLNHPNTVAIYDYGRTPEGVFYYAMEYLDGIDLQVLVDRYGPQSEGRVIRILKQICGSLYEAHSLGLVHRDIKPANVMLNRRGAESDVVKVLDFGLVKALDESKQAQESGGLSGTPLYMSPEAIQNPDQVDARSDLYAVGAIGYFLITGQPIFNAASLAELLRQHMTTVPDTPTQRLGRGVSPELEGVLLACLEKNGAKRPQTARDLAARLDRVPTALSWTLDQAEAWWGRHERSLTTTAKPVAPAMVNGSGGIAGTIAALPDNQTPQAADTSGSEDSKGGFEQTMAFEARNDLCH